ncbi:MAG: T9SS type A sorting domain-containing protein [Bacteroidia bacterium]|nr:T9SS type A sorting domain-containing protein [Bacteroidia bacterium]MDW8158646.1 T9SS type A sorting domain-containing protein [Bacteroidia bacterium]
MLLLCFIGKLQAQILERYSMSSGGRFTAAAGLEVEYNIGETIISTVESSSIVLTQGFIQPLDVFALSSLPLYTSPFFYTIYPNPTQGDLFFKLGAFTLTSLRFELELFSLEGKKLQTLLTGVIEGREDEWTVPLPFLSPSAYLLKISFYSYNQNKVLCQYQKLIVR